MEAEPQPDAAVSAAAEKPARTRRQGPTSVAVAATSSKPPPNWYDRAPPTAQMFLQFGFAGLMAVVFLIQFRETSAENRASREMYRDDMAAMRTEIGKAVATLAARDVAAETRTDKIVEQMTQIVHRIDKVSEKMTDVNHQLQRTTDAIRAAGVDLKKAADKMDEHGGIPPPRLKYPYPADPVTGPGGSP